MPRMSDAKNRGMRGASGTRGQTQASYHYCWDVAQSGCVEEKGAGSMLSNWPNTLSHMEALFRALLICAPPVCHRDTINTMCRILFPLPLQH